MLKRIACFVFLVLIFTRCEDHDLRTPAVTVVVHGNITYWKYTDAWAFLSDDNGIIFDAQQLPNNSTIQLKAVANASKLNLTIFSVYEDGLNNYYFRTFTDLPRGQEYHHYEFGKADTREPLGTVKISINNFTEPVETAYGGIYFSVFDGYTTASKANPTDNSYAAEVLLYTSPQDILISSYRNGIPVYQLVKNVTPNSNLVMNFNEFTQAETIFQPNVPMSAEIFAYPDDSYGLGYRMASWLEFDITSSTKPFSIGYPAVFKNYFTRMHALGMQLEKQGTPVTTLDFPDLSYTLINSTIGDFEMEISSNATHKEGYWIGRNVGWRVFSPGNKRSVIKTIPDAIRKKYKDMDALTELNLYTVGVYKNNSGDYYDWLDLKFGSERAKAFEIFLLEKQVR